MYTEQQSFLFRPEFKGQFSFYSFQCFTHYKKIFEAIKTKKNCLIREMITSFSSVFESGKSQVFNVELPKQPGKIGALTALLCEYQRVVPSTVSTNQTNIIIIQ